MTENEIARTVVDSAFKVHSTLGPGLFESVYEAALAHELSIRGLHVARQRGLAVTYDTIRLNMGFRADLVVQEQVIVEVKSVESLAPIHRQQLLTYLRVSDLRLGLLINFNSVLIKDGIRRVVNRLEE